MRNKELLALGIFSSRSRLGDRIELLLVRGRTFSTRVDVARMAVSVAALIGFFIGSSLAPRLLAFAQQPPSTRHPSGPTTPPRAERAKALAAVCNIRQEGLSVSLLPGELLQRHITSRTISSLEDPAGSTTMNSTSKGRPPTPPTSPNSS